MYAVSVPYSSKLTGHWWALDDTVNRQIVYDAVVPLSGIASSGLYEKLQRSPVRFSCYYPFSPNINRVIAAAELLAAKHARLLLFGDLRHEAFSEADVVKEFLVEQGLSPDSIIVYGQVDNTLDEARQFASYAVRKGITDIVLVTSSTHMRRAAALFRRQGVEPALLSVGRPDNKISWRDFMPSGSAINATGGMFYEWAGYLGYRLKGNI
ncbi:MAG: YdcF family protein [Deltaproteobacteria bacterium]|nr:YdcF family protein [Deltaproteobacteria bacterium]